MPHVGPVAVYRLFDKSDVLLYVGVANRPPERFNSHGSLKQWWDQVARTEIEWHPTRGEAEGAEAVAILNESPLYNIQIPNEDGSVKGSRIRSDVPPIALGKQAQRRQLTGMPARQIRVATELWTEFGIAAKSQGTDRASLIRALVAWHLRRPGARLPERPPAKH